MFQGFTGTQLVTADALVGPAQTGGNTKGTRVFSIHIISGGGGAAVVSLRNGQTVSGAVWITETGTVSTGKTFNYGKYGILFPNGCFCDIDANTTSVAVQFEQEGA